MSLRKRSPTPAEPEEKPTATLAPLPVYEAKQFHTKTPPPRA